MLEYFVIKMLEYFVFKMSSLGFYFFLLGKKNYEDLVGCPKKG